MTRILTSNFFQQVTHSSPDLRLPNSQKLTQLKNILTTFNSVHQAVTILRATDTCVPGLYPLIFPTRSRATPPLLKEFGVVGGEAYELLRVATREGPVRLHAQLVVEIGKCSFS